MQKEDLLRYCELKNFEIYQIYEDIMSGAKDNRPALNQLMADARKGKFQILACWKLDRISRNSRHFIFLLEELLSLNIGLHSYQEGFNASSPIGKAMVSVISIFSELERETIRERVCRGIANAKRKGKTLGRPKKLNDKEVYALKQKGLSYRAIAKQLNTSVGGVQRSLARTSKLSINT